MGRNPVRRRLFRQVAEVDVLTAWKALAKKGQEGTLCAGERDPGRVGHNRPHHPPPPCGHAEPKSRSDRAPPVSSRHEGGSGAEALGVLKRASSPGGATACSMMANVV